MKSFAVFVLLVASAVAGFVPEPARTEVGLSPKQQRLVVDLISSAIEDISVSIREAGLDPLDIEKEEYEWSLPVPAIFSTQAVVERINSRGLSNIVINDLRFSTLATRLNFDLELPRVEFSAKSIVGEVNSFGGKLEAKASGRFAVTRLRIVGEVRVSIGIISGISIRNLNLNFSLGGIESDLNVVIQGNDISKPLNNFLGVRVPRALHEHRAELNELLEIIVLEILNDIL